MTRLLILLATILTFSIAPAFADTVTCYGYGSTYTCYGDGHTCTMYRWGDDSYTVTCY
jgi:hypothetical protein